jgi:hypothetical protein
MGSVDRGRLLLVGLVAAAAGCAGGGTPPPAPAPTPTPARADPVTACTNQLVYWAGVDLRGEDDGGDYQHRGLTSEQNDALRAIVADAGRQGSAPPADQVERQARAACERIATLPPSSGF